MPPTVTSLSDLGRDLGLDLTLLKVFDAFAAKTADETVTNNTLQNDDHLFFPIGASTTEMWFVEVFLYYIGANTAMDIQVGFTGPSGATANWGIMGTAGVAINGWGVQGTGGTPSGLAGTIAGPIASGTTAAAVQGQQLGGWVTGGGTAGNIQLQWAQSTTDAGALTMKKGSFLRATKLVA